MYKKKQQFVAHKTPHNKPRKQSNFESPRVNNQETQDTRYTPTPVPGHPVSRILLYRLESENKNWTIQGKDSSLNRHSPDSALTVSSNGSSLSFKRGPQSPSKDAPPNFRRSQSIPNLFESTGSQSIPDEFQSSPPFTLEHSRKISDSPGNYRTNSLRKARPTRPQGPVNVHQGRCVRVKVGLHDDNDAAPGVIESSSLVKNKYKSEPNLFDPKVNEPIRNNDKRQPFSIRTIEMKKTLGMFGFVLSCKYVLDDPLVPKELRCFPHIDTVSVEGVAYRTGIRQGFFVLEINGQSVELSSINRCNSLLQMGGDHLQLKVASNNQTNHPAEPSRPRNAASNFSRDVPSSDSPRHRVRYRESALQKRLTAAHPSHRMKRASSTPNLADDDHNHIYEELCEPLLERKASTPELQAELGKYGSDASKVDGVQSNRTPQKTAGKLDNSHKTIGRPDNTQKNAGRPDNTQKNAGRPDNTQKKAGRLDNSQKFVGRPDNTQKTIGRPDNIQKHVGRPDKTMDTGPSPKKNSADLGGGSGKIPPSLPPRPVTDWSAEVQGKSQVTRGSTPATMKMREGRNDAIKRDGNPAKFETKVIPGVGISNVVSVSSSSSISSISETPMKLSSFTGPFNDGAQKTHANTASRLSHDSEGTSKPGYQDNKAGMLVAENGKGRDTPASRAPGNTCRTVDLKDSVNKSTPGSQDNKVGALVTENGRISRFHSNTGRTMDMEGPAHNATPVSKAFGNQGGKSEFNSLPNLQEKHWIALNRNEEPLSLLDAIRQHPLVHNDRFMSTDLEENSTVASPSHETYVCMNSATKQGPLKARPPPRPTSKPKYTRNEVLEGAVNCEPDLGRSSSQTQELTMHPTMPDSEVKNLRQLKPENRDCGRKNDLRFQIEKKAERGIAYQQIQKATKTHVASPPAVKTNQKKGDVLLNALKSSEDSKVNRHDRYNCITRADSRNPRQAIRSDSHLTQVFHLDGATVDQSYSENRATDENQVLKAADPDRNKPEPIFRFDVSSGMLFLSDATVDQSCDDSDLIYILPPPPQMEFTSVASSDSMFSETRSQDKLDFFWSRGTESSNYTLPPYIDRAVSIDNDSVFLEGIESPPPPPAFIIDPKDSVIIEATHESRSNPLAIAASRAKVSHPKASQDTFTKCFRPGTNLPQADNSTSVPLPPSEFQSVSAIHRFNNHLPPPELAPRNQWGRPNGAARRQKPSEGSVSDWSCSDVADWLCAIGLEQYAPSFMSHRVDGPRLSAMTRGELIELGVTEMTHRRDIERGVLRLKHLISS